MLRSLWQKLFDRSSRTSPCVDRGNSRRSRRSCRLQLEVLEDRVVPTAYNSAFNGGLTEADWMTNIPGNTLLSQMSIPGTHDTMTYAPYMYDSSRGISTVTPFVGVIVSEQTQTQDLDLATQLNDGIRSIDIRVGYDIGSTDLGLVHSNTQLYNSFFFAGFAGNSPFTFSQMLGTVKSFLQHHSNETILMRVNGDGDNKPSDADISQRVYAFAAANSGLFYSGSTVPTLDQARGKIVILRGYADSYNTSRSQPVLGLDATSWPDLTTYGGNSIDFPGSATGKLYIQGYYNVPDSNANTLDDATTTMQGHIRDFLTQTLNTPVSDNTWFINNTNGSAGGNTTAQAELGIDPAFYAYGVTGDSPDNLGIVQSTGNLNGWLSTYLNQYEIGRVGTVIMDFPEHLTPVISQVNGRSLDLIDQIIGYNWPFITAAPTSISNGGTTTISVHSMKTSQTFDVFTARPDLSDASKTISFFAGQAAHQGNGVYTVTLTDQEDSTDVYVTASAVLVGYPTSSSTSLPSTATIHVTGPVPARTTSTAVSSSKNLAVVGTPLTFTATVTAPTSTRAPEGTVEFWSGTTDLGAGVFQGSSNLNSIESSTWTLTTSALPVGTSQDVHAVFSGGTGFANSTGTLDGGESILAATRHIVELPATPGTSANGQSAMIGTAFAIPIRVQVTDLSGNLIGRALVDFTAPTSGATGVWAVSIQGTLFPLSSNPAEQFADSNGIATLYFIANQTTGTFQVTAEASLASAPIAFQFANVRASATSTSVNSSQATASYGTPLTFTATVTNTGGAATPTGSVEFFDGSTDLGSGSALSGSGAAATSTFTISTLTATASPHAIKAVFTPTGAFVTSDGSVNETINPTTLTATIVGNPTKTYNGTTAATLTSANYQLSGLANGDQISVTNTAGTYNSKDVASATTVTASLAAADFAPANGVLLSNYVLPTGASGQGHIDAAPLTITANSLSKVYGQTITFAGSEFTSSGLQNGETIGAVTLSSPGAAASASVADSPYGIQISAASAGTFNPGNYQIQYVNGVLTVLRAATMTVVSSSFNPSFNGQDLIFTATVTSLSPSAAVPNGAAQFFLNGLRFRNPVPLTNGRAAFRVSLGTPAWLIGASFVATDGNFTASTGNNIFQTVNEILSDRVQAIVDEAARTNQPISAQTYAGAFESMINIINNLRSPASPVSITLNLSRGTYSGIVASPPPNITLAFGSSTSDATLVGRSPALTVTRGQVIVQSGITFRSTTNAPTILVQGGALTMHGSTIQAAAAQPAVLITGGTVDLGSASTSGGNTFIATPTSNFIVNRGANPVPALGDTFQIQNGAVTTTLDTSKLADDVLIAERIIDGRQQPSAGLVTFVANNVYVTPLTGRLQRIVSAVPAGYTINVQVPTDLRGQPRNVEDIYGEYTVSKPLTIAYQNGPTLHLAADNLFGANTSTLYVTGGPQDNTRIHIRQGDGSSIVEVAIDGYPDANFSPTGGIVAHGGGGKNAQIDVAGRVTLPALLFADGVNARLQAGGGPTVEVGAGGSATHLEGGRGRNVLIAGPGPAHLEGHGGDDLLIAGTTAFDHNAEALAAVLQEWNHTYDSASAQFAQYAQSLNAVQWDHFCNNSNARTDYLIRVAHLTGGPLPSSAPRGTPSTGLNLSVLLTATTVQSNGGGNCLDGDHGLDLFFAADKDKVKDVKKGELVRRL